MKADNTVLENKMVSDAKYVYVSATNSIGVIIDKGFDTLIGAWYRTDCDGIRDAWELLFLHTKDDVRKCLSQLNAQIAPSTRKAIGV